MKQRQHHPMHALAGWWEHWAHAPRDFDHRMNEELHVIADRREAERSSVSPF